jgi:polyisoprenyl-teichoic acid--peptidoglycan teichoic acid transferase
MDNFKNRKPIKHNLPRRTLDGFAVPGSNQGSIGFNKSTREDQPVVASPDKSFDDMRRPEGFHSASQPQITAGILPSPVTAPVINPGPRGRSRLKHSRRDKRRLSSGIKQRRSGWQKAKRVFIGTSAVAMVVAVYFVAKIYIVQKNIFRGGGNAPALAQNVEVSSLKGEGDGRVNILLLGIGGPGHDAPDLSDTIVVVSIDPVNNQTALLSIPRDLWVEIPGYGSQKINAAFSYGKQNSKSKNIAGATKDGIELAEKTLEPILGIPIHYHAVVDFTAFKQSVDAVGGVAVNVPEELYDPTIAWENNYNPVIAQAGVQSFNGNRALLYAKSRQTSSDFARGERQRLLLVALKEKILSAGTFSNPLKISQLLDSLGDNVYTDFSSGDFGRLYEIAGKIPSTSIFSLDLVTPPHNYLTTGPVNGLSAVLPKAGLFEYDEVKNYVRNALKDGFISSENAQVVVLNGTSITGLATLKSNELKSYGYNVTNIGDTPTEDYQKTLVIDVTKYKKYTKNYLEQRFKVTASASLPVGIEAGTADFVIILGADMAPANSN